jgi:hypothetical protein
MAGGGAPLRILPLRFARRVAWKEAGVGGASGAVARGTGVFHPRNCHLDVAGLAGIEAGAAEARLHGGNAGAAGRHSGTEIRAEAREEQAARMS